MFFGHTKRTPQKYIYIVFVTLNEFLKARRFLMAKLVHKAYKRLCQS